MTASLNDPDGGVTGLTWQWARSPNRSTAWTDIPGARLGTYTPVAADSDMYLRATASYNDAQASGQSAQAISNNVVNTIPAFPATETGERSVAENTAARQNVGAPVMATDSPSDTLTYTLGGDDAESFDVAASTGQLMTKAPLDYETKSLHRVNVTATDRFGASDTIMVIITIIDVNEHPSVVTGDTVVDYSEHSSEAVSTYAATDAEDDPADLAWSVLGADMGAFDISATGELTFKEPPDFEAPTDADADNVYEVTVAVTDSGSNTATRDVTVTVINVREDGVVTLSTSQPEVGVRLTASLNDPDGGVTGLTWQWARSPNRSTAWIDISGARLGTYTPVAADSDMYLRATASYTDAQAPGQSAQAISNNVVNTIPAFPATETGERSVAENTAARQNVGAPVMATDSPSDTLTYTLGGDDAESFDVAASTGQLMTKAPLDYETKSLYRVNVTATDRFGASDTIMVIITVIDVNEHPSVVTGDTVVDYSEHSSEAVSTYAATDAEDDPADLAWSVLGADMGAFDISATGELTFKELPDFEAPTDADTDNVYEVTVVVTDSGFNTATRDVTVTVINVREDGVVTLSSQPEVGVELTASLTDPDGGVIGLTWQWARSADGSTGWTNISGATSANYTPVGADANMFLRATATYTDVQASGQTASAVTGSATQLDLISRYDANGNGIIERDEAIAAVRDYFDRLITRDQVIMVIQSYFASAGQSDS